MNSLFCEIVTPERTLYSSEVTQVSLPTAEGEITVLPHHIPLVGLLVPGELHIVPKEGDAIYVAVSGGFIEVSANRISVLADSAERADEIDEQQAEAARQQALAVMSEKRQDVEQFAKASAALEQQLARLRVARRRKRHGGSQESPTLTQS